MSDVTKGNDSVRTKSYQFLIGNVRLTDADADAVEAGEVSIPHR